MHEIIGWRIKQQQRNTFSSVVKLWGKQNSPCCAVMFDFSLGEFPDPHRGWQKAPSGAATQGADAASQGWRAQAKTGLKYPCDWLRGDPCSQLLFICMLVFKAVSILHRSCIMMEPWNIVIWWHQSSEIQLLAIAVQMICAFHYSSMIIKSESGEGKWQTKADTCQ